MLTSVPAVPAAVLVATTGPITVVVPLEATAASATEAALPVVVALLRGRTSLAALLIVLLHQLFSLITLQLDEGHPLQEITSLGESEVGLERNHGWSREEESIQREMDGEREER